MSSMSPQTLKEFSRICRFHRLFAADFRRSAFRLYKTLAGTLTVAEVAELRAKMNESGAIIHGVTALEYFLRTTLEGEHPVELAVDIMGGVIIVEWLSSIGFTLSDETDDRETVVVIADGREARGRPAVEQLVPAHERSGSRFLDKLRLWQVQPPSMHLPRGHTGAIWVAVYKRQGHGSIRLTISLYNAIQIMLSSKSSECSVPFHDVRR